MTDEQPRSHQPFKFGNAFADGGGGNELTLTRSGNAPFIADGDEQAERRKIKLAQFALGRYGYPW
jgi:hypothetical protein